MHVYGNDLHEAAALAKFCLTGLLCWQILSVDETVRNPRSQPPDAGGAGGPMPGRGGPMGMRGRGRGRGRGMRR